MAIPAGAKTVEYYIGYEGDNPELIIRFTGDLKDPNPGVRDEAFRVAAEAMVSFLAGVYPEAQQPTLLRTYHGTIAGDPWPAVEVEEPEEV